MNLIKSVDIVLTKIKKSLKAFLMRASVYKAVMKRFNKNITIYQR